MESHILNTSYTGMPCFKTLRYIFVYLSALFLLTGCDSNIDSQPVLPAITVQPKRVVLLLPLSGQWKEVGQAIATGFKTANNDSNRPIKVSVLDTQHARTIQSAYTQAEQYQPDLIIGPLVKTDVQRLAQHKMMKTPVLTLNYLDTHQTPPANFYQFGLSPIEEAKQAAVLANAQGHEKALVIVPKNAWGKELGDAFTQQWMALGHTVVDRLNYKPHFSTLNYHIRTFLRFKPPQERRTDFDVMFLGATSEVGRQINPLLAFYFAADVPIYSTSAIYNSALPTHLNRDLDPMVICDAPWHLGCSQPHAHLKQRLRKQTSQTFAHHARYYALGVDAYYIAMQLAQLDQTENHRLQGASGDIYLTSDRYILRTMPCARFRRGIPSIVPESQALMQHVTSDR